MKCPTLALVVLALLAPAAPAQTNPDPATYKMAPARLTTPWSDKVDPAAPLPEYPRPQMRRAKWQNLNGLWTFAPAEATETFTMPPPELGGRTILVPFPVESALSGVGERVESARFWCGRAFDVPADFAPADGRVLMHFGAVDWEAHVFVNNVKVGTHQGGFDPFSLDVTAALAPGRTNVVWVGVYDPTNNGRQPVGKQRLRPEGIFYTPVSGIWQTVWLEPTPRAAIRNLRLTPDVDGKRLVARVDAPPGTRVKLEAAGATAEGDANADVALAIAEPKLWSTVDPHLYDLKVSLLDANGATIDSVDSYFGMRKVGLGRNADGMVTQLLLNDKPLFQVGPLDQGWWPDGLFTAPTDEALKFDVTETKRLGFNMIRKHIKVEPARWYYHCDRAGLLVWQDFPAGDAPGERPGQTLDALRPTDRVQFERELRQWLAALHNAPSIAMWVVFNEGFAQHDTPRLTNLVKELDPSRLVSNASGWHDYPGVGDVIDLHKYPEPGMHPLERDRASVLGEFGGLGLATPDHLWQGNNWGYRGARNPDDLATQYENLFRGVYALRPKGLSAVVYTQTTDVEGEINGFYTYDRRVLKVDAERVRKANLGLLDLVEQVPVIADASGSEAAPEWKYTTERPAATWAQFAFTDTQWKTGRAGFGFFPPERPDPNMPRVGTEWKGPAIWLRRKVELTEADLAKPDELAWNVRHDEAVEVYVNGVSALARDGFISAYEQFPLTPEARVALRPGPNVIAVHCRQTVFGQYVDVGLVRRKATPNPTPREDAPR